MSENHCGMIHHVALKVGNIPYFVKFFEDVFDMTITKTRGEEGNFDSVWLSGGVQLLNTSTNDPKAGVMDHVSFLVDSIENVKQKAEKFGATPYPGKGAHWFQIPEGLVFELKTE